MFKATGLVAAALILLALALQTYFATWVMSWTATHSRRAFPSRNGKFPAEHSRLSFERSNALFPEKDDGLRVAVDQWPSWRIYLVLDKETRRAALIAQPYYPKNGIRPSPYSRTLSLQDWQVEPLLRAFDRRTVGYLGSTRTCTDGTGFTWERWDHGKVRSGSGNAACTPHYADLEALLAAYLSDDMRDAPFKWSAWFTDAENLKELAAR